MPGRNQTYAREEIRKSEVNYTVRQATAQRPQN